MGPAEPTVDAVRKQTLQRLLEALLPSPWRGSPTPFLRDDDGNTVTGARPPTSCYRCLQSPSDGQVTLEWIFSNKESRGDV